MNEVLNNIKTRRSIRSFKSEQIEDMKLNEILEAAIYAPSGMNKQSWKFTAIQNSSKIQELAKAVKASLDMPENKTYNFYGAPTFIIVSNERNCYNGPLDCATALENIFLAATSLGIGSCWINQLNHCCDDEKVRFLLNSFSIPEDHVVWGCAAIGYADECPEVKPRKGNTINIIK